MVREIVGGTGNSHRLLTDSTAERGVELRYVLSSHHPGIIRSKDASTGANGLRNSDAARTAIAEPDTRPRRHRSSTAGHFGGADRPATRVAARPITAAQLLIMGDPASAHAADIMEPEKRPTMLYASCRNRV